MPFQRSATIVSVGVPEPELKESPAASQEVAAAQDTALSVTLEPVAAVAGVSAAQLVPFQRKINGVPLEAPTAVHAVAAVHETPVRIVGRRVSRGGRRMDSPARPVPGLGEQELVTARIDR